MVSTSRLDHILAWNTTWSKMDWTNTGCNIPAFTDVNCRRCGRKCDSPNVFARSRVIRGEITDYVWSIFCGHCTSTFDPETERFPKITEEESTWLLLL